MKGIHATLLAAVLLPMAASAADFDYSYADLAYSRAHSSSVFGWYDTGIGYRLDGSFGFAQHWFVEAAYQHDSFDFDGPVLFSSNPRLEPERKTLGAGFHTALADRLDIVGHADYVDATTKFDLAPYSDDLNDHGYLVGVGLRFQATPALELDAGLDYDDVAYGQEPTCGELYCANVRQDGKENVLSAAARYRFGMFGLGLEYRHSDFQEWRDWLLSLRVNF